MRNRLFISILWFSVTAGSSLAQTPVPFREQSISALGTPAGREQDVTLLLNQQTRDAEAGQNSLSVQDDLESGRARAEQMVEILKTEEMQKALQKVTKKGKQALKENPALQTPIGIIAGAVGLWVGNSVRLFQADSFIFSTRIEGRNRASEFSMESPLLNGKFRFSAANGIDIYMNRRISSINSQAELTYNAQNRVFSTSIRKRITPHLDFTFGAAQIPQSTVTDGNARIEYRFSF